MPTVFRSEGFIVLVLFPPREHGPAHVHVAKADEEVLINLPIHGQALSVRENRGMRDRDVARAMELVGERVADCIAKWEKIHGKG